MRSHLSLKQIASVIHVSAARCGQSIDPAVEKVARLYVQYPEPTLRMVMDKAEEIRRGMTICR